MAKPMRVWSGSEWVSVSNGDIDTTQFLTSAAAANLYFPISSSVSNFGTIKTLPATENVVADLITDELTFASENGIILNATASADQLTISTNATWNNTASAIVMRDGGGSFDITRIDFNTSVEPGFLIPGQLQWNIEEGTLDLGMSGSTVQSIGMEFYMPPIKNNSGVTINNGDFVMATGSQGDRITVAKAVTDGSVDPMYMIGIATQNIPDGSEYGLIVTDGIIRDINTSTWPVGTILYPNPSVPGGLTDVKPTAPSIKTAIAFVLRQKTNSGRIYVRMSNGSVLGGTDSNVNFTTVSNNDVIIYSTSSSYWYNKNLSSAIQEVDGEGSGIDSDLLDGHHSSYFINTSSAAQIKNGDLEILGELRANELYVTGSLTYISTNNLQIEDSVIYISKNQFNEDVVDIGFIAPYGDETTSSAGSHYHTGLIRSHVDKKWRLLDNSEHPINNIFNFDSSSTTYATLMVKTIEVSSSAVILGLNSDLLDGYHSDHFLPSSTASAIYLNKIDASNFYLGVNNTANHAQTASSINWVGITNSPDFLTEGVASATYISNTSPATGTSSIVYSMNPLLIRPVLQSPQEKTTISTIAATASINFDILLQTVLHYTSSAIGNWHLNIRGGSSNTLSSLLEVGESVTLAFFVDQGTTSYYQLNLMIDGVAVTPKWQGGSAPTEGNISGTDVYSYNIVKTSESPNYRVFATLTGFA